MEISDPLTENLEKSLMEIEKSGEEIEKLLQNVMQELHQFVPDSAASNPSINQPKKRNTPNATSVAVELGRRVISRRGSGSELQHDDEDVKSLQEICDDVLQRNEFLDQFVGHVEAALCMLQSDDLSIEERDKRLNDMDATRTEMISAQKWLPFHADITSSRNGTSSYANLTGKQKKQPVPSPNFSSSPSPHLDLLNSPVSSPGSQILPIKSKATRNWLRPGQSSASDSLPHAQLTLSRGSLPLGQGIDLALPNLTVITRKRRKSIPSDEMASPASGTDVLMVKTDSTGEVTSDCNCQLEQAFLDECIEGGVSWMTNEQEAELVELLQNFEPS